MMKLANRVTGPLGVGFLLLGLLVAAAEARSNFDEARKCYLGVRGGTMLAQSDLDGKYGRHGAALFRYGIVPKLHSELAVGYGHYATEDYAWDCADVILPGEQHPRCKQSSTDMDDYWTHLSYVQLRLLWAPVTFESWAPYLYGGAAYTYFNLETLTPRRGTFHGIKRTLGLPVGGGLRFELSEKVGLEASGGYTFTQSDRVDELDDGGANDHYMEMMLGLTYDIPCLPRRAAKPPVPVVVPEEVVDTDGDGLTDHEERTIYFTNPLMWDSDGDGLSDGEEVHVYGTNPNKADTDGGGIPDGEEVWRGTDPLDPADDWVTPPRRLTTVDYDFPTVHFGLNRYDLSAEDGARLDAAARVLVDNPGVLLRVHGHTDNTGYLPINMRLS